MGTKQDIKISVIIPIFNAEDFLPECLQSICDQTLHDIEIICVNNGSNDNSLQILESFAKRDQRIRILNITKSNAGAARNAGLKIARGEYLSFIDADDFTEPKMLESTYNLAVKHRSDIVVFDFYTFDNNTKTRLDKHSNIFPEVPESTFSPDKISSSLFGAFKNCPWNKLFRKDFITEHQIKFQEIPRSNDIFFTYIALATSSKITVLKRPLINYRINNKSSLQSTNELSPLSFWDAFKLIKYQLTKLNLYSRYEQTFLTELLNNAIYNLEKITDHHNNAYSYLFNTIRYGTEIEFSISDHPATYYNPDSYRKYQTIIKTPSAEEIVKTAIAEITSSRSHKIGLAITKIPRFIRNVIHKKERL